MAQRGNSAASLKQFQELNSQGKDDYCLLVNLGVLYLQQGQLDQSKKALLRATHLDRYHYLSYYNLLILHYHLLQNIATQEPPIENRHAAILGVYHYLHLALSCAYVELALVSKDLRFCAKATSYC
jgi:tetratricopeptide (TPR) repeat protein